MASNSPIEAIATQVMESPTFISIIRQSIQRFCGMIFWMTASNYSIIATNCDDTIIVGDIFSPIVIVDWDLLIVVCNGDGDVSSSETEERISFLVGTGEYLTGYDGVLGMQVLFKL